MVVAAKEGSRMHRYVWRVAVLIAATVAAAAALGVSGGAAANNSEQVIFSGTGSGSAGPVGFWVWCEADSNNPYAGECNGAMYFYALGITKHVDGEISEPVEHNYVMDVVSRDGSVACTLANGLPISHGPHNTVSVSCTAPAGFTGTSTTAVVNVTGP
jgi:hypothetical protein